MKKVIVKALALTVGLSLATGALLTAGPANASPTAAQERPAHTVSDTTSQGTQDQVYDVSGTVIGALFYSRLHIDMKGGGSSKHLDGDAGGLFTPGAGVLVNAGLHTDDLARLFSDTVSFQINSTPLGLEINFFDGNSHLLGYILAGAISTVLGTGGGTASWS
ncbi:VapA/VapB family virulence-associated protein [Lysinibacter sp. HNR]|uniref:VapA/VapB family virulence-associated protein n=1 Tax=Lysinibacter sp. HNR TaxID=3031408 RepID=UPI002434905D|nr:VapA/VapB family virulence-associated protein [Lysinibacter sp. HNR]WGD37439.1 VapA/VapB family virulence-associated protein [Lysinibacter sp. HNR]